MSRKRSDDEAKFAANPLLEAESTSSKPNEAFLSVEADEDEFDPKAQYLTSKVDERARRRVTHHPKRDYFTMYDCFQYNFKDLPTVKELKAMYAADEKALIDDVKRRAYSVLGAFNELNYESVILKNDYDINEWRADALVIKDSTIGMVTRKSNHYDYRTVEHLVCKQIWGAIPEHRCRKEFLAIPGRDVYEGARMYDLTLVTRKGLANIEVKARDIFDCQAAWQPIDLIHNATEEKFQNRKATQKFDYLMVWCFNKEQRFEPHFIISREQYDEPYYRGTGPLLSFKSAPINGLTKVVMQRSKYDGQREEMFSRFIPASAGDYVFKPLNI